MWHIHTEPSLLGIVVGMRNGLFKYQIHGGNASIVETAATSSNWNAVLYFVRDSSNSEAGKGMYRMEYFGSLTNSNRKNVKHLNLSKPKKEFNILEDSQKASKQGVATQITIIEDTITKMNEDIKHIYNSITLIKEYKTNMCNICYLMPKNGVFNHQKISHVYSCYGCAKKIWRNSNRCPVCNIKIKSVTKIIVAE
ncbi:hypothetical protein QTP88_027029 [Uroleucon formosanum]